MTPIFFLTLLFYFVLMEPCHSDAQEPYSEVIGEPPSYPEQSDVIDPERIWPNQTLVYAYALPFPEALRQVFVRAMRHIMARTCIRFRRKEDNDTDYIFVVNSNDDGPPAIGRIGGPQDLFLHNSSSDSFRKAVHELVHAIGFYHEHQRTDRDQYVTINWGNIQESEKPNFIWLNDSFVSPFGVPYDYMSIMHYTFNQYSANGNDTITPLNPDYTNEIGIVPSLSDYDIKKINNMNCPGIQGIRLKNVFSGEYLTAMNREMIITSEWLDADTQKWTANWDVIKTFDGYNGSYLKTWRPQESGFEVITVNQNEFRNVSFVKLEKYDAVKRNQLWTLIKRVHSDTQWLLVNGENYAAQQCLVSVEGEETVQMRFCDPGNLRHRWRVYNV